MSVVVAFFAFLGLGTTLAILSQSERPTEAIAQRVQVKQVASSVAGGMQDHFVALSTSGTVYAWGSNAYGQLGNGTTTDSLTPVPVDTSGTPMAGKTIVAVAAGTIHSMALDSDGAVYAWGANNYGHLGDGTTTQQTKPVAVATSGGSSLSGKTVTAIAAGAYHSLALDSTGAVHAWGYRANGRIGIGSTSGNQLLPVSLASSGTLSGKTVTKITAGDSHSLAIDSTYKVHAWGAGANGRLGDNNTTDRTAPVAVDVSLSSSLLNKTVIGIAAGTSHSLALDNTGVVHAWGLRTNGRLGVGATSGSQTRPVSLATSGSLNGLTVTAISAGSAHSAAVDSTGAVHSWGLRTDGRLGVGATSGDQATPVSLATSGDLNGKTAVRVTAGAKHSVAVGNDGTLYTWGDDSVGFIYPRAASFSSATPAAFTMPLGPGTPSPPVNITTTPGAGQVALAWTAPVALHGEAITGYSLQYRAVGAGSWTTVAISGAATGHTRTGLTNGTTYQLRLAAVTAIGTGDYSSIMLATPRAGVTFTSVTPNLGPTRGGQSVTLGGANFALRGKEIRQVSAGPSHSLALDSRGQVYAWGNGANGRLGTGTTTSSSIPMPVTTAGTPMAGKTIVGVATAGHSLALDSTGMVYAWGQGSNYQLGNGANTDASMPIAVTTSGTPMSGKTIVAIAAGANHSLALDSTGAVYSWGLNGDGRLGDGTTTTRSTPVAVATAGTPMDGKKIVAIAAGGAHSLAVDDQGAVYAWGAGANGRLGNGGATNSNVPVAVTTVGTPMAGKVMTAVSAGELHSVALDVDGKVYSWGGGANGRLGNGAATDSNVPVLVTTLGTPMENKTIVAIAAAGARHTLALDSDGVVYSWGLGVNGQLGRSSTADSNIPVAVTTTGTSMAGKTAASLATGLIHSVVVDTTGAVHGWGYNTFGRLGDGTTTQRNAPVASIVGMPTALVAGGNHSLALDANGRAYAWGPGGDGQIGDGSTSNANTPVGVSTSGVLSGKSLISVAGGDWYSLALDSAGVIYAWGQNTNGQLGDNSTTSRDEPVVVTTAGTPMAGKTIVAIAAGGGHSLALDTDGQVYAWGSNSWGQLGYGVAPDSSVPVAVDTAGTPMAGKKIIAIAAGSSHSLAMDADGRLYAWGNGSDGRLGDGASTQRTKPVAVVTAGTPMDGKAIAAISAGDDFSLALDAAGDAYAWGSGSSGQLGRGSITSSNVPVAVTKAGTSLAGKTIASVSAGSYHALALATDGTVHAWGNGGNGRLGNGGTVQSNLAVAVTAAGTPMESKTIAAIGAGNSHSLAIDTDGITYTWGQGSWGRLGDGAAADATTPVVALSSSALAPALPHTTFGGTRAPLTIITSSSTIHTITPPHTPGSVGLTLSLAPGHNSTLGYTYGASPSAPLNITATPGTGQVALAWRAPIALHGEAITGYSLQYRPVGGVWTTASLSGAATTHTRSGLTDDTTYQFRLAAVTSAGQGSYSAIMLSTPHAQTTIASISPNLGPTSGNQQVMGTGTNMRMKGKEIVQVAAGSQHSLALDSTGQVYAWGDNSNSQLGDDTTTRRLTPVAVKVAGTSMAGKTIVAIAAGGSHSLALDSTGQVHAWGLNTSGQLGDGTTTSRLTPVAVDTAGTPMAGKTIVAVAAGSNYSLVLDSTGTVYSWGLNSSGQLGDGTTTTRTAPVVVAVAGTPMAGKTIVDISAGSGHALALDSSGVMYAWGTGGDGKLGNGGTASSNVPVAVTTLGTPAEGKTIVAISAGVLHSVALDSTGTIYSWGWNVYGQLGDGTTTTRTTPVAVTTAGTPMAGKTITAVLADSDAGRSFAIDSVGAVYAWGSNSSGGIGDGTTTHRHLPVAVVTAGTSMEAKAVVSVSAGSGVTALDTAGVVYAWGGNTYGQLGNGLTANTSVPVATLVGTPSVAAAAGGDHSVTLDATGAVRAYGRNHHGQLGSGTTVDSAFPGSIATAGTPMAGKTIIDISSRDHHTLAVDTAGAVYAWGRNHYGQLGDDAGTSSPTPNPVAVVTAGTPMAGKTITQAAAGSYHSLALDSTGAVYGWGRGSVGERGDGTTSGSGVPVAVVTAGTPMEGKKIVAIAAGDRHSLALDASGRVYAWGLNANGQLGDDSTSNRLLPVAVATAGTPMAGKTIVAIAAGGYHSLALADDGTIYAWGSNADVQLGDNTTTQRLKPVAVVTAGTPMAGKTITAIAGGLSHSLALDSTGTVYAWGHGANYKLGNGSTSDASVPVAVTDNLLAGKTIVAISAGAEHSMAVDAVGAAYTWGDNNYGQLGDGTTTLRTTAVGSLTSSALAPLAPRATFGGVESPRTIVASPTTLHMLTPPHSPGLVNVAISLAGADTRYQASAASSYTYIGPPSAPLSLVATPLDTGVGLSWSAPAVSGGGAITDYVIQYSSDGGTTWLTYADGVSTATNVTVPTPAPLSAGVDYTFRVAARNAYHEGPYSATATGRVRYITVSAPTTMTINVTATGGVTRMSSANHNVLVSTNAPAGYDLQLEAATSVRNLVNNSYTITPSLGTQAAPTGLVNSTWGYRVPGQGGFGSGSGLESNKSGGSAYTWAGIPTQGSPATIRSHTAAATNHPTTVWYGVSVQPTQPSGTYSSTVTYTAVTKP